MKRQKWNADYCKKRANYQSTDGYGSLHPYKGNVAGFVDDHERLPIIPKDYEFYYINSWGLYIRRKKKKPANFDKLCEYEKIKVLEGA